MAHTCFYQLDMPHYRTALDLQTKLHTAIHADPAMGIA